MKFPLSTLKRIRDPHTLEALQIINSVDQGGERTVGDRAVLVLLEVIKNISHNPSKDVLDSAVTNHQ